MSDNPYNALLYWLSTKGSGSMEQFFRVCTLLQVPDKPYRVRRNLQLLGHLEVKLGARAWSVAPASWVRMPGQTRWFLCGQRSSRWQKHPALQITPQSNGPDRWESDEPLNFEDNVAIADAGCTAENLLQILVPIQTWIDELVEQPLLHAPSAYRIDRWNLKIQAYEPWHAMHFERGIYRFRRVVRHYEKSSTLYNHPTEQQKDRWLVADFTGLCFANHYYEQQRPLGFRYNPDSQELWVPFLLRWPYIYERCLVLSTGRLPEIVKGPAYADIRKLWLYYPGIAQHTAEHLGQLLSAKMILTKEKQYV